MLLADSADVTTVAVKTLKESAAEVEKKDLLSELEVRDIYDCTPPNLMGFIK